MYGHAGRNGGCRNATSQHPGGCAAFVGGLHAVECCKTVKAGRCLVCTQQKHGQAKQHKAARCQRIGGQQACANAKQGAALQAACPAQALHPACQLANGDQVANNEQRQRQGAQQRPGAELLADQAGQGNADDGARPVQGLGQAQQQKFRMLSKQHGFSKSKKWASRGLALLPRLRCEMTKREMCLVSGRRCSHQPAPKRSAKAWGLTARVLWKLRRRFSGWPKPHRRATVATDAWRWLSKVAAASTRTRST